MSNFLQMSLMLASALLIIIADAIIKKESLVHGFTNTFTSPLMILSYLLYFIQIIIAVYIFRKGGELAIYTNLYIIFYSILGILTGVIIFSEHLSIVHYVGIVFALIGAVLLNLR
jgi:hypothetical protein